MSDKLDPGCYARRGVEAYDQMHRIKAIGEDLRHTFQASMQDRLPDGIAEAMRSLGRLDDQIALRTAAGARQS